MENYVFLNDWLVGPLFHKSGYLYNTSTTIPVQALLNQPNLYRSCRIILLFIQSYMWLFFGHLLLSETNIDILFVHSHKNEKIFSTRT